MWKGKKRKLERRGLVTGACVRFVKLPGRKRILQHPLGCHFAGESRSGLTQVLPVLGPESHHLRARIPIWSSQIQAYHDGATVLSVLSVQPPNSISLFSAPRLEFL